MTEQDVLTLALPAPERANLARELIVNLDNGEDSHAAEVLLAELGQRASHVENGTIAHPSRSPRRWVVRVRGGIPHSKARRPS